MMLGAKDDGKKPMVPVEGSRNVAEFWLVIFSHASTLPNLPLPVSMSTEATMTMMVVVKVTMAVAMMVRMTM